MFLFLSYIKNNHLTTWRIIEKLNGMFFSVGYKKRINNVVGVNIKQPSHYDINFRQLLFSDLFKLQTFLSRQNKAELQYFETHKTDSKSISQVFNNSAIYMFGAFHKEKMIGYFLMRFFINKQCFVGRFIDSEYRNLGIGKIMNGIMYNIAWQSGFRVFASISTDNSLVIQSHASNPYLRVRKELKDNYLLVEFVKNAKENKSGVNSIKSYLKL